MIYYFFLTPFLPPHLLLHALLFLLFHTPISLFFSSPSQLFLLHCFVPFTSSSQSALLIFPIIISNIYFFLLFTSFAQLSHLPLLLYSSPLYTHFFSFTSFFSLFLSLYPSPYISPHSHPLSFCPFPPPKHLFYFTSFSP